MSDHRGRPMSTFFFDMLSTSSISSSFPKKVIGPDASEKVLGRPGGSGKLLGASGGRPRGVREASWAILGLSGGLRGPLARVWGALGAILERPWRQSDFGSFF